MADGVGEGIEAYFALGNILYLASRGQANGTNPDRIVFDIPEDPVFGAYTINVGAGGLPALSTAMIIDGTTEPQYPGSAFIVLNGAGAGANVNGLTLAASGSTIRGLVINRFDGYGIRLQTGSDASTIVGNIVGADAAGAVDLGNRLGGVYVESDGAPAAPSFTPGANRIPSSIS